MFSTQHRWRAFHILLAGLCVFNDQPARSCAAPPRREPKLQDRTPPGAQSNVALAPSAFARRLPRGTQPNILFISADDLNNWVGALGLYADAITPHIDSLAQQGMLFTRAYTAGPHCNISRSCLLTGIRPSTSGLYNYTPFRLPLPHAVTLPQHFMAHGYYSLGNSKIFHFNDSPSWHDVFVCTKLPSPPVTPASGVPGLGVLDWAPLDVPDTAMADENAATWAADFLSQTHTEPFFLGVGFVRPHAPWYVPRPYFDMHPLAGVALPPVNPTDLNDVPPRGISFAQPDGLDAVITWFGFQQQIVQSYLASVSFVDVQVGRIMDALNNGPNAGNTIIVFFGDHGFHFGQKQHWSKYTLWEESAHVPLIVVAPGITAPGQQCHRTVGLIDLYPTLIDLCGLTPRSELEGVSVMPLLLDPSTPWDRPVLTTRLLNCHSVRSERWRYIRYDDSSEELYDHDVDPNEWDNLASNPAYTSVKVDLASWMPTVNAPPAGNPPARLYVKADATGLNDGSSWQNAFTDLQDALTLGAAAQGVVLEIWVASGVYPPAGPAADRRSTFLMVKDLKIYGGFAGGETSLSQRNPSTSVTVLSGDLNGDDPVAPGNFANNGDNCYHVVTAHDYMGIGLLDGFTITGGNADGPAPHDRGGGTFYNWSSQPTTNCVLTGNSAISGGGMYISGGSRPVLRGCVIAENRATGPGGGIFNDNVGAVNINCQLSGIANARPQLFDCIIRGNTTAVDGGGVYNNNAQPRLVDCLFSGNIAQGKGGAIYNFASYMPLVNCTFSKNSASLGGGVYNGAGGSQPLFTNCILWGNTAGGSSGSTAQIGVQTGTPIVSYSCVQGGWMGSGNHNLSADPGFIDADGPDNLAGTADDDLRLGVTSPCRDAGNNDADTDSAAGVQPLPSTDLAGNPRFLEAPATPNTGLGTPPIVDLGVYEGGVGDCNDNSVADEDDIVLGSSRDCNSNTIPDECDISGGASADCNTNGSPDSCDIALGISLDCNTNGVPDGCDLAGGTAPDCNINSTPDSCDIRFGTSLDCDGNGFPDPCDVAAGTAADCNANGAPDDCDLINHVSLDCNITGTPDECDLVAGTSMDANTNGVPDECESGTGPGDCDNDGDVDLDDSERVIACITGPGNGPAGAACICIDLDGDADVDLRDMAIFWMLSG